MKYIGSNICEAFEEWFSYFFHTSPKQFKHDILLEAELDQASGRGFGKGVGAVGGGEILCYLPSLKLTVRPLKVEFLLVNTIFIGKFQLATLVYRSVHDTTIEVWEGTYPYPEMVFFRFQPFVFFDSLGQTLDPVEQWKKPWVVLGTKNYPLIYIYIYIWGWFYKPSYMSNA